MKILAVADIHGAQYRLNLVLKNIEELSLPCCPEIVDSHDFSKHEEYAKAYNKLRERKGVTLKIARKRVRDANILGLMKVKMGEADAFISGLTFEYPDVIKPALRIHRTAPGTTRAAGVYLMIVEDRVCSKRKSSVVPTGLVTKRNPFPRNEFLGYSQSSLRDYL